MRRATRSLARRLGRTRFRFRNAGAAALLVSLAMGLTACASETVETESLYVTVIGDQWSSDTAGPAWPYQLTEVEGALRDVQVRVDARAGSGYLSGPPDTVAERIAAFEFGQVGAESEAGEGAEVIVLALGANDAAQQLPAEIREQAVRSGVAAALHPGVPVVVLGTMPAGSAGATDAGAAAEWDQTLRAVAAEFGVPFVPLDAARRAAAGSGGTLVAPEAMSQLVRDVAASLGIAESPE